MTDTLFFFLHHSLNLLWGVLLSAAFSGVRFTRRNIIALISVFALCGITQLTAFAVTDAEQTLWKLYPLLVHLPLILFLIWLFKKRPVTAASSVALAYLCCQPSNWFGLLADVLTSNSTVVWCSKIVVAAVVAVLCVRCLASYISMIFNKDTRSVLIFSCVPFVYYAFDYVVGVYTDLWVSHYRLAAEFLAFSLCIFFMLFCVVYYKEYEKKIEAELKEEIVTIASEQRAKEVETIKKSNIETSLLRHDMRLLLSNLSLCIEKDDKDQALKMISGFVSQVEAASVHRYCSNDTLNYILTNFESRCAEKGIDFQATLEIEELTVDEILFSSIISNGLENAINAQKDLAGNDRSIKLMLKNSDRKLLLSIKNPFSTPPVISDGLPVTDKIGHGYGTQSIRYLTEKLGGKCRFSVKDNMFILRVVI